MNINAPIHTELTECQDCYKCLRECPVKAIKIESGRAAVVDELCIRCGHCVAACPAGAKRGRSDLERAKRLIELKREVYVSVAPSWTTEFPELSDSQFIHALKKLGVAGVSETALGAEEVSAQVAAGFQSDAPLLSISSACPAVVQYVKKYRPELAGHVTSLLSPLLAHCKILRKEFGEDIGIIFVGPCFAKKGEADGHGDLLDVAITFAELRAWWEQRELPLHDLREETDGLSEHTMLPRAASEGRLYPIDGGMIRGIEANCRERDGAFDPQASLMTFSGMEHVRNALEEIGDFTLSRPLFLEALACEGGCVNGPAMNCRGRTTIKRLQVLEHADCAGAKPRPDTEMDIAEPWNIPSVDKKDYTTKELRIALREVGKHTTDDEMNCGGCGYDACREFARALLDGRAEPDMCVGYMRNLAAKKTDALIRAMPSGVVWVDKHMRIVECNRQFTDLLGENAQLAYDACPGLGGAKLDRFVPFADLFERVLRKNNGPIEKRLKLGESVVRISIFTIEEHRLVGGVMQDITAPAIQKERIVTQARAVIARNMETVQQIAYLLGENAAESEVMLNSVIDSFSAETERTAQQAAPPSELGGSP